MPFWSSRNTADLGTIPLWINVRKEAKGGLTPRNNEDPVGNYAAVFDVRLQPWFPPVICNRTSGTPKREKTGWNLVLKGEKDPEKNTIC